MNNLQYCSGILPRARQSWISIALLVIVAIAYCSTALAAPFWSENDTWSNILPVIQYRHSIIKEHVLPLHTNLWYGGWNQWQNPLSSLLYFPATLIWLLTPLEWGTRLVFLGHLIYALIAGWKLGSVFFSGETERVSIAIILVSPMLPALHAGHIEKVMAWGWVLLSIYFLLNDKFSSIQRGLGAGACWGVIALTGANYQVFYQGVILVPLVLSIKDRNLFKFFFLGSLLGLLHLPNVWHLIGYSRSLSDTSIPKFSSDPLNMLLSLVIGFGKPFGWDGWALIGLPIVYLFVQSIFVDIKAYTSSRTISFSPRKVSLLFSLTILALLATGSLYRGHSFLDTFRVPARALAFIGLGCTLYVLLNFSSSFSNNGTRNLYFKLLLVLSVIQIGIMAWPIRPGGALHSPHDPEAQQLVELLKRDNATSVWFSMSSLRDMYIDVALMQNGISLPNVYYGDMGQTISVNGDICGYSFDHLIANSTESSSAIELHSDLEWLQITDKVPMENLQKIDQITMNRKEYTIYRVICEP